MNIRKFSVKNYINGAYVTTINYINIITGEIVHPLTSDFDSNVDIFKLDCVKNC
jgi:hypothetical protein